ncbi:hypothetical protein A3Q56_03152 [Intoshia linei]|uniref:E2F/DP family winged-helix DNA-binding domain-containing protein n=1 Tax=Intoshia linei TaxID=1819745 RepID=A0A177B4P0_9BILA|nr:hypothetical protein A3Q56_03152 [Intoshia linei]
MEERLQTPDIKNFSKIWAPDSNSDQYLKTKRALNMNLEDNADTDNMKDSVFSFILSDNHDKKYDTSLGLLTKRFIDLIRMDPNGIVNLTYAAKKLSVHKRRIYDITNVLEGIDLIKKIEKCNVQWIGQKSTEEENKAKSIDQIKLHADLAELECIETYLEHHIDSLESSLKRINESEDKKYPFHYFPIKALNFIIIKAPPETRMEVPNPIHDNIQMFLKSDTEIEGFICPDEDTHLEKVGDNFKINPHRLENMIPEENVYDKNAKAIDFVENQDIILNDNLLNQGIHFERDEWMFTTSQPQRENPTQQFEQLHPALLEQDYMFSLEDNVEGITDLYDDFPSSDLFNSNI